MSVPFDTGRFARSLQDKADLTTELAEGIAEAFQDAATDQLATKSDLAALRDEIAGVRAELRMVKGLSGATLGLAVLVLVKLFLR